VVLWLVHTGRPVVKGKARAHLFTLIPELPLAHIAAGAGSCQLCPSRRPGTEESDRFYLCSSHGARGDDGSYGEMRLAADHMMQ